VPERSESLERQVLDSLVNYMENDYDELLGYWEGTVNPADGRGTVTFRPDDPDAAVVTVNLELAQPDG